mgnify:FL=1
MATFEELNKRYNELAVERDDVCGELNDLKYKWYDAYIETDEVKDKLGKCFKVKDKETYYKIIAPAPLKSGRVFVDVSKSQWICIITSHTGIDNYSPATLSDIVPIKIETKYIPFGSSYFRDEEISPAQFDDVLESNIGKLKSFINTKIISGKTNPKAEMLFHF